jgi:hypothetical protein
MKILGIFEGELMIKKFKADQRGTGDFGWLQPTYSFSFANYFNPQRMGFGKLRVLNDDIIAPGYGFDMHPHEDMEIVTIVLEGELEHKDSIGEGGVLKPGDIQHMSAGSGVMHSEKNLGKDLLKLLQIWVEPKTTGIKPVYEQKHFDFPLNELVPIVSNEHKDALSYHQEGQFVLGNIDAQTEFKPLNSDHGIFVFIIEGKVDVNGTLLERRDEAQCLNEDGLILQPKEKSRVLIIEVPVK